MALYADSAYLPDIVEVAHTIPIAGVTTNPTILLAARERGQSLSPQRILTALLQAIQGDVFMQPGATNEQEMIEQALAYIQQAPERVILKIPMTETGMRVARQLEQGNPQRRIAFTAVTTTAQAYVAATFGAEFIIPYFNRMERAGVNAALRVAEMAKLLRDQHLTTRILAASVKTPQEATSALLAGAHDITAPPRVLLDMVSDPQTEDAVARFSSDWHKMNEL